MRAELVEPEPNGPREDDGARKTCNTKLDCRIPPKGTGVDGNVDVEHLEYHCVPQTLWCLIVGCLSHWY